MSLHTPAPAPVLSLKEKLAGLPSADAAFGSKQRVDTARGLKESDRHQLKLQFEALAAAHDLRVNDVVDHYALHRHTYWYFIDTAKPAPMLPERKEQSRNSMLSVQSLPAADQLALLARVKELINPLEGNLDLSIACVEVGITVTQYYSLERRCDELHDKQAKTNSDDLGIKPVQGRVEATDDAERLRMYDATALLAFATRQRIDHAARMLGISGTDITEWKKVLGFTALLPGHSGKALPLPKAHLQLDTAGKVRVVHGLDHLQAAVKVDRQSIAKRIGFHRMTIEAWIRNLATMEEELVAADEAASQAAEAAAIEATKPPEPVIQALPEADAETMGLYERLACPGSSMHPTELVRLWRRKSDAAAMDSLVAYYAPAAESAMRRVRGQDMAGRVQESWLRSYALPGVWQAIKGNSLKDNRPFYPFACKMAFASLREELQGDGMTPDLARKAYGRLMHATERWRRRHPKEDRDPSPEELAPVLRMSVWEVCDMIEITQRGVVSLNTPVGDGGAELGSLIDDRGATSAAHEDEAPVHASSLNGITTELLGALPDDRRHFIETFYFTGSMSDASATLGLTEAQGWSLHHVLTKRLRAIALTLPAFGRMNRRHERYGDGRPSQEHLNDTMTTDFETTAEYAPQLIEHATRWIAYALSRMTREELLEALEDPDFAPHYLMDHDVASPEEVNRTAFFRVARLVLESETAAVA